MNPNDYRRNLWIASYITTIILILLFFSYNIKQSSLLKGDILDTRLAFDLPARYALNNYNLSFIKRIESDHKCRCRLSQAIYLAKYLLNGTEDKYFYESTWVLNDQIVIKSHAWKARE